MEPTTPGQAGPGPAASARLIGGRYRLLQRIGSGGMGAVWRGDDEVLHRPVAVKEVIAPPELSAEERRLLRERTLREARAAARMTSPHVVTVYDVVDEDDRPWIVMEWLDAPTLAEAIREGGALEPAAAARIGLSLVSALRAAHAAGVLHRDVKPSNVMLTDAGAVLTDFGIASAEGDPALTTTGILIGSPSYMPPERVQGQPATAASDLWSLGATLYSAVEGRPPFERQGQLPTLHAVVYDDPPQPVRAGPLTPLLLALLAKDPRQRPGLDTVQDMLSRALAAPPPQPAPERPPAPAYGVRYAEGEHVQALPFLLTPDDSSETTSSRRSWTPVALAVAAVLLLTGLGAMALVNVLNNDASPGTTAQAGEQQSTKQRDRTRDDRPKKGSTAKNSPTNSTTPTRDNEPGRPNKSNTPSPKPSNTPRPTQTGAPAGFAVHNDPTGFSVAVPQGWTEQRSDSTYVDFLDPQTGGFLRIDQTTTPKSDPVADWISQEESVAARLPDYERIRIEPVEYNGWNAADWEFTWQGSNGQLHVLDRGFVTGPDRGYALYWSMPESAWGDRLDEFETVADSFQPAD
jgi:serine/threonine protein kinase